MIIKKKLFCARDKFGVKPFYYFYNKQKFCFSSEIKSFPLMEVQKKFNRKAIFRYLNTEYHEHECETFYDNIYKLKPGHYIILDKSGNFVEKSFF